MYIPQIHSMYNVKSYLLLKYSTTTTIIDIAVLNDLSKLKIKYKGYHIGLSHDMPNFLFRFCIMPGVTGGIFIFSGCPSVRLFITFYGYHLAFAVSTKLCCFNKLSYNITPDTANNYNL